MADMRLNRNLLSPFSLFTSLSLPPHFPQAFLGPQDRTGVKEEGIGHRRLITSTCL